MSDTWMPAASLEMLHLRASCYQLIRDFFQQRGVLEVETPILSAAATTDPQIESFSTQYHGPGQRNDQTCFLVTSPEFHMKRLLAAGSGPIYQLGRVFRQGEFGNLHNPEFTLLEWYRPGYTLQDLISEVETLVRQLLPDRISLESTETLTYAGAFDRYLQIDIHSASIDTLASCAMLHGVNVQGMECDGRDAWLDLLMSHCVQPHLGKDALTFISHYPASQAALAELDANDSRVALRFELFLQGIELANGFQELLSAREQEQRFNADIAMRERSNKSLTPMDTYLLQALQAGLPPCSGVALGVDRLFMIMTGVKNLQSTFAFPFDRA